MPIVAILFMLAGIIWITSAVLYAWTGTLWLATFCGVVAALHLISATMQKARR